MHALSQLHPLTRVAAHVVLVPPARISSRRRDGVAHHRSAGFPRADFSGREWVLYPTWELKRNGGDDATRSCGAYQRGLPLHSQLAHGRFCASNWKRVCRAIVNVNVEKSSQIDGRLLSLYNRTIATPQFRYVIKAAHYANLSFVSINAHVKNYYLMHTAIAILCTKMLE